MHGMGEMKHRGGALHKQEELMEQMENYFHHPYQDLLICLFFLES